MSWSGYKAWNFLVRENIGRQVDYLLNYFIASSLLQYFIRLRVILEQQTVTIMMNDFVGLRDF